MREVLITSSVLILALLVLRRAFRQKIARRVQYALWGLVLVRLLVPVSLPALDFSVLTMAEPVRESISTRLEAPAFTGPVIPVMNLQQSPNPAPAMAEPANPGAAPAVKPAAAPADRTETPDAAAQTLTLTEILGIAWLAGVGVMAVWLAVSNLSFAARLRKNRVDVGKLPGIDRKVYMVESGLASPCLFGVLRPAIYLTPSAVTSEASLRHVLAHEETHARHLDPLWSLLRSVCLAVYWFDPLVWIAASASKTDCELACDEGAIRRLGEEERLAYGRTLLSLIPIRRLPGNPLLSATTMSSDKKRLRDRVTRIAENRKTRKLALLALAVLMTATCVFTFAGCVEKTKDNPAADPAPDAAPKAEPVNAVVPREDGPLTTAELYYFNVRFFNGDYMNIRNQFLSSVYDEASDIDLFELFYCGVKGGDSASEEERAAYEGKGGFVDCDITKVSTAGADAVLLEYAGLTLAETSKRGLENFTYLPEFDAYFYGHGDTNYRYQVDITDGVWEGDLVHLYYNDTFYADGWKCVTLRAVGNGGYQFVSNVTCEKPVISTAYPAGEPVLTIPLDYSSSSRPSRSYDLRQAARRGDFEEMISGPGKSTMVGEHHIVTYRSKYDNKSIYVAEVLDDGTESGSWKAQPICLGDDVDTFYIESFDDIFGWEGFVEHYSASVEDAFQSYYGVDENGDWYSLIHVPGYGMDCRSIDLDGDGVTELLCTDSALEARVCYQKDGNIYTDNIAALLKEAWSEAEFITFEPIQPYARCLSVQAFVPVMGDNGQKFQAVASRSIYFDGESLLVYKPDKTAVDHVTPGVIGPEDVMTTLRQIVQEHMAERTQDGGLENAGIDDWRIVSLTGPWYEPFEGFNVEIYRYNYELHATAPENVGWAGGIYVDEDGWVSPGYPDCDYLYFRVDQDGSRTYLFHDMSNDVGPDSEWFHEALETDLIREGFLEPGPGVAVQAVWDEIRNDEALTLTLRTEGSGGTHSNPGYNMPGDLTTDYTWEALTEDQLPNLSGTSSLVVNAKSKVLVFYDDPSLVYCSVNGGATYDWYRVTYTGLEDPFACEIYEWFRRWYDEVELNAHRAQNVIGDDGLQSREEIVRKWTDVHERTLLDLTEGSRYRCTYMDVRDIDLDYWNEVDMTEFLTEYKESRGAKDVFLFNYSAVFVPENDPHWFMAGNTVEYEGNDAPEGALQYWRCGYMYLMDDGWHCDGVGTGP